ncbi:hypothetical protein CHS0354_024301 [Potamilus streckersoni]|uniref:Uncharacterized protein n=1 Tax=Potamilus streckersoni TaxID=2493646 RepID=A0AAE0VH53_9BIVA|nr:hypothetical protein CHS0354_024301 [Potamilus streckersoni]
MSNLYTSICSLHLHALEDSDSDGDCRQRVRHTTKAKTLPFHGPRGIGYGDIHKRYGSLTDMSDIESGEAQLESVQQKLHRSVSFNLQEREIGSGSGRSLEGKERKLPSYPGTASGALKGILTKNKRFLPAQPDSSRIRRLLDQHNYQHGTINVSNVSNGDIPERKDNETKLNIGPGIKPAEEGNQNGKDTHQNTHLDNVSKVKSHIELSTVGKANAQDINIEVKADGIQYTSENSALKQRNNSENTKHTVLSELVRERTLYEFNNLGFANVVDWCSKTSKTMSVVSEESSGSKVYKDEVRSPSPKSNVTWDRSSSGYSSDERGDPKSPPPPKDVVPDSISQAHGFLRTDTLVRRLEEELTVNEHSCWPPQSSINQPISLICGRRILESRNVSSLSSLFQKSSEDNMPKNIDDEGFVCGKFHSRAEPLNADAYENQKPSRESSPFGFSKGLLLRKPAITPGATGAGQQKIQYRKSFSEAMIHLKQTNGRPNMETKSSGLSVFGRSLNQVQGDAFNVVSGEAERTPTVNEFRGKCWEKEGTETSTGTSTITVDDTPGEKEQLESLCENPIFQEKEKSDQMRIIRRNLTSFRNPKDLKNTNLNSTTSLPKDEDIRRSLQEMKSPRRRSTSSKNTPIRGRHAIQVPSNSTSQEGTSGNDQQEGKQGIKFFGKKMWRAPSGQPEGADPRPFSPFGGTLPPSKIKKKQIVEVLV